ncbi:MAG: acetate--CoA ligase family protein [Spirochaetes bacterium]|nr:acetate--CoA ligase family protein [Spirochaetota bacterium]
MEITRMVPPGTEMIINARFDPSFGPIVMCGPGGIYAEGLGLKGVDARILIKPQGGVIHEKIPHRFNEGRRGKDKPHSCYRRRSEKKIRLPEALR